MILLVVIFNADLQISICSYRYLINIFTFDNIRYIHKITTTAIGTTQQLYDCTKKVRNKK